MTNQETRPEPEALLAETAREGHGRLKVFLGAAPGVGKTYAMLEAARIRMGEGVDVIIGIVETHGRAETNALCAGLEIIPRRQVAYRGRTLVEMDVDAIIARRPELVLIDELAHNNVPESRHPKRWQDVADVLAAGISVYSTLNIQHIESLNDVVARISGVRVSETVPDKILELANEIELVDLPPEELIDRLRQGKVYVRDQIARAIQNFFSKGNLTALRELAMRIAADRVDAQMIQHMRGHAIAGPWPTQERVLACVNESPAAKSLIRTAKRIAERAHAPWIAVNVVTPSSESLPNAAKDAIADALRLAETLGAEATTVHAESHVANEIIAFARARNVSRIVVGRPRPRKLFARFTRETVAETIIRGAVDFEVTIASEDWEKGQASAIAAPRFQPDRGPWAYAWATVAVAIAGLVCLPLSRFLPAESLSLFFLLAVLWTATRFGLWPSVYASFAGFAAYNFAYTAPYYTLYVDNEAEILTLVLFLAVSIVTGNLAARLRNQVKAHKAVADRTTKLYEFTRRVASVGSLDDVVWAAVVHVAATMNCHSLIMAAGAEGGLSILGGFPPEDRLDAKDRGAAEWAWEHGEPAGWTSATLPSSSWLFIPLKTSQGRQGLLGVRFARESHLAPDERRLLDALADQVALAIERARLTADVQEAQLLSETERLRAALLSSVSHDFRTPLVSIIGAASSLLESGEALGHEQRRQLIETIGEEGERLDRYVQNLLNMTRIGYGALAIGRDWVDLKEVAGRALRQLGRALDRHPVRIEMADDLPAISGDPVLLEQVLVNLLDNASKYSPDGAEIVMTARRDRAMIIVTVSDHGPGIRPEDRDRIFDMFYRVRAGDLQRAGTGLGLAICRGIVEAHGGSIRADPAPERGTRMEVSLPVADELASVAAVGGAR